MMKVNKFLFVAGMGLWTAVTLAGSIYMVFNNPFFKALTDPPNPHRPVPIMLLLFGLILFVIGAIGGGLWGAGLAWLMKHDLKLPVKVGAWVWGATVTLSGVGLYVSQIPIALLDEATYFSTHDLHYLFTLAFLPGVGIAAMVNTRKMTRKLGFDDLKTEVGRKSGLAAAMGFLMVSMMLLFGLGWEVGRPGFFAGYRYSMLVIMYFCNFGAALAGGLAMGWVLVREQVLDPAVALVGSELFGQVMVRHRSSTAEE
jgi:hypothetical protein